MILISWTKLLLYGIILGIANIIPGVSGGTVAVILNIYTAVISAISKLKTDFKRSIRVLLPLLVGGAIGVLLFSNIISFSLENYFMVTNFFFIGLILGSMPMLYKRSLKKKLTISTASLFIIGIFSMALMIFIKPTESAVTNVDLSLFMFIRLFLSGVIAAAAMIIPGISGSFILLILGSYSIVIYSIANLRLLLLVPIGLGCLVGLFFGAKLISFLFSRFETYTYCCIFGLVAGSIFLLFPGFTFNLDGLFSIVACSIATYTTYWFSREDRQRISIHKKGGKV